MFKKNLKDDETEKIVDVEDPKLFEYRVFFKHCFPLLKNILHLKIGMLTMTATWGGNR